MASPVHTPEVLGINAGATSVFFKAGESIAPNDLIYFSGFDDEHPIGKKASASQLNTCQTSLWLCTEAIPVGEYGIARPRVVIKYIDTSSTAPQDPVYLSDTPGVYSFSIGTNKVQVGEVLVSDAEEGSVLLIPLAYGGVIATAPNIVDVDNVTIQYNNALALEVKEGGLTALHFNPASIGDGLDVIGSALTVDLGTGLKIVNGEIVPDYSSLYIQPEHPPSSSVITIYVATTGNDTTGDGTVGSPFLTLRRAQMALAQFPIAANVISVGAGTFDISGFFPTCSVTIQGTLTASTTATISSITSAEHSTGTIAVVTGLNVLNNALVGTLVKYTSGPANNIYGIIYGNSATAGGNTTVYISHGQGSVAYTAPVAGNTFQLQTHSTILNGQASYRGGGITIQDCSLTGTAAQLVGVSPATAMTFSRCLFTGLGAINHTGGNITLTTCYLGMAGNSLRGIFRSTAGLVTFSSGCVINGANAGTNNYLLYQKGVNVDWSGNTIVRSLRGIRFEGSDSVISTPGTFNTLVFETKDNSNTGAIFVNTEASGDGVGGNVYLPNLFGQVTGNWAVDARLNAVVYLGTSSSLVAVQGTNAVTVNGSTATSWAPEGTIIYNGSPAVSVVGTGLSYASSALKADIGSALKLSGNSITVDYGLGLSLSGSQLVTKQKTNGGVFVDANGLYLQAGTGMKIDASGNIALDTAATVHFDALAYYDFAGNSALLEVPTPGTSAAATPKSYVDSAISAAVAAIPDDWTKGVQPENAYTGSLNTIYVASTGNDTTGTGAIGAPFLTLRRAQLELVQYPSASSGPTISIGAGTFSAAGHWNGNGCTWQGTTSVSMSGTVSVVTTASADRGIWIDATGLNVTLDQLRGARISFTSGTLSGTDGVVYKNQATSLGVTSLYIVVNRNVITSPGVGATFNIKTLGTTLTGSPIFAARNMNINDCVFSGNSSTTLSIPAGASVSFFGCSFSGPAGLRLTGGQAYLAGCYYACVGDSVNQFLRAYKSRLRVGPGNFFDAINAGTTNQIRFVGSVIDVTGSSVFAYTNGTYYDGCQGIQSFNSGSDNAFIFEVLDASNNDGILVDTAGGAGSKLFLPALSGEVLGTYCIKANYGAVVVALNSSLSSASGSMVCSADGGSNECYHADRLTAIILNSPTTTTYRKCSPGEISGFKLTWVSAALKTVSMSLGRARSDDDLIDIISSGSITINLSASGANGLDTGAVASSTTYAIWVIATPNGGTVRGLASTSFTSPTMPSGYSRRTLVGFVITDGSSNIREFITSGYGKEIDFFWPGAWLTNNATNAEVSLTITGIAPGGVTRSPLIFVSVKNPVAVAAQYARVLKATGGSEWYATQANTAQSVGGWMERNTTTIINKSTSASLTSTLTVHGTKFIRGTL